MKTININGNNFTIEELNQLIEQSKTEKIEAERLFLELFQGLEKKLDIERYPYSVFYLRDGKRVLEIRKNRLYVDYYTIWSKFNDIFGRKDNKIQYFIKDMLVKHFKWNGLTPDWYTPNR